MTWHVQASSSNELPQVLNLSSLTLEGAEVREEEERLENLSAKQALAESSLGILPFKCPDCVQQRKEMLMVLKKQQACLKPDQMGLEPSQRERDKELSYEHQFQGVYLRVCQGKVQAYLGEGQSYVQFGRSGKKGTSEPQRPQSSQEKERWTKQVGNSF